MTSLDELINYKDDLKTTEKSVKNRQNSLAKNKRFECVKTKELPNSNCEEIDGKNGLEEIDKNNSAKQDEKSKSVKKEIPFEVKKCENNDGATEKILIINISVDLITFLLFGFAFATRTYKLSTPNNIVFDELHYGKYVSLYLRNTFFFEQNPPLGKQLIAGMGHLVGYDGNYTFSRIGASYSRNLPLFWLRLVPALCGSFLSPAVYKVLLEAGLHRWTALLGGILIILDNALLTQSRFILMEPMLLLFSTIGILFLLRFNKSKFLSIEWFLYAISAATFFTFATSVKYSGFYSSFLAFYIMCSHIWKILPDKTISNIHIACQIVLRGFIFTAIPAVIYVFIFYIHLKILYKAGPHDSAMTSAFQASLDGGLASITKGQPLHVAHGSQITLRHTHGRICWLHSHSHVYPVRYPDDRGSSHQQQVTCYSFKDVNNWWIVKKPDRDDLVVNDEPEVIKHGDVIQLVHGITSRALNSHDVAAPMTPQCQEISGYIDYNVSMPGQLLWKIDIINRDKTGPIWHAIRSHVRLIHEGTGFALRFSGRQLAEWGFNQHEVVGDRVIEQDDTIWNVEEHRYTKTDDQKEREKQMLKAEMIPTRRTHLSFWEKFLEVHAKMLLHVDPMQSHMYSSEPLDWPFLSKGVAYWVDKNSNAQIFLLGNVAIWYSGTIALTVYFTLLIFYLLRRRRLCNDISENEWETFKSIGQTFFAGYLIHYLPYFFVERTLFLHHYMPALVFKIFVLCYIIEHIYTIFKKNKFLLWIYKIFICIWFVTIVVVYKKFLVFCYGRTQLQAEDLLSLRWKEAWDFILHKDLP